MYSYVHPDSTLKNSTTFFGTRQWFIFIISPRPLPILPRPWTTLPSQPSHPQSHRPHNMYLLHLSSIHLQSSFRNSVPPTKGHEQKIKVYRGHKLVYPIYVKPACPIILLPQSSILRLLKKPMNAYNAHSNAKGETGPKVTGRKSNAGKKWQAAAVEMGIKQLDLVYIGTR